MVPGVVGSSPISHPTRRKFRLWLRNDLAVVSASTQNFRLFQIEPAALGFDLSFLRGCRLVSLTRTPASSRENKAYPWNSAARNSDRGFPAKRRSHETDEPCRLRHGEAVQCATTKGCSQAVRQGTLTPSFAGSSPAIPATSEVPLSFLV